MHALDQLTVSCIFLLAVGIPTVIIVYGSLWLWDNGRRTFKRMLFGNVPSKMIKEYVAEHWDRFSDSEMAENTGASISVVNHTRRSLGLRRTTANAKKLQKKAMRKLSK